MQIPGIHFCGNYGKNFHDLLNYCTVWYHTKKCQVSDYFSKLSEFYILKQYFPPKSAKFLDISDTQDSSPISLRGPNFPQKQPSFLHLSADFRQSFIQIFFTKNPTLHQLISLHNLSPTNFLTFPQTILLPANQLSPYTRYTQLTIPVSLHHSNQTFAQILASLITTVCPLIQ